MGDRPMKYHSVFTSEEPTHGFALRLQRGKGAWLSGSVPFPGSGGA